MIIMIGFQACSQELEEQFVPNRIEEIREFASQKENIRSVLISQNDHILGEWYFDRFDRDSLESLRSATKSIMSLLIGIAVDQGFIGDVDDDISKYLEDVPEDKQELKVRHLLSMTSGAQWNEGSGYNDWNKMIDSGNPYRFWMERKLKHTPGGQWQYSSGDMHMLSVILTEASGMSTLKFAKKYFFDPLGITHYDWQKFKDGYYAGGSRLSLKPRDMLKIGQLCKQLGVYNGQRIISEQYLKTSTSIQTEFQQSGNLREGYGFGWWAVEVGEKRAYMAMGYGGQAIVIIPSEEIVVSVTHRWKLGGNQASAQEKVAQDIAVASWAWSQKGPLTLD